jgi:hypothetical protein
MTITTPAACLAAAITLLTMLSGPRVQAAARFGGTTDDSVCDIGATHQRPRPNVEPAAFIQAQCRNGQLLIGNSIVPSGNFAPAVDGLSKRYCTIADIKAWRTEGDLMGLRVEYAHVRCKLDKLDKLDKSDKSDKPDKNNPAAKPLE